MLKMEDVLLEQADLMREARLQLVATLESYIKKDQLSLWEAHRYFCSVTCMSDAAAQVYLLNMTEPGSPFKALTREF